MSTDPNVFDAVAYERKHVLRAIEIGPDPDATASSPGYVFTVGLGRSTTTSISLNAGEIRRWAAAFAKAAIQYAPEVQMCPECGLGVAAEGGVLVDHELDGKPCNGSGFDADPPSCPACHGDVHVDLAGSIWTTSSRAIDHVKALHRPVEYRPGDHYAGYKVPPKPFRVKAGAWPPPRPEVVTVCEECQRAIDEADTEGGYAGWTLAEYPCRTIRAMNGEEVPRGE